MTITAKRASEAGALDGFQIRCDRCSLVWSTTLESAAHTEAAEHAEWHDRSGR